FKLIVGTVRLRVRSGNFTRAEGRERLQVVFFDEGALFVVEDHVCARCGRRDKKALAYGDETIWYLQQASVLIQRRRCYRRNATHEASCAVTALVIFGGMGVVALVMFP